jgi:hypothetical protein
MTYTADTSSNADVIDFRDLTERVEEIEAEFAEREISVENGAKEQTDDDGNIIEDMVTCETCGRTWNDALVTDRTPAPSGRCPYEYEHEELAELKTLTALLDNLKGYGGDHKWRGNWYPGIMVRDSFFEDYARDFAEGIGAVNDDAGWPATCIDWEAAAKELQQDYSTVEYESTTYWYR